MIDKIKRVLAILALLCAAVFTIAVVVLMVMGQLSEHPIWIYGPMSCFLALGLTALLINWLQKKAAEHKAQQEQQK